MVEDGSALDGSEGPGARLARPGATSRVETCSVTSAWLPHLLDLSEVPLSHICPTAFVTCDSGFHHGTTWFVNLRHRSRFLRWENKHDPPPPPLTSCQVVEELSHEGTLEEAGGRSRELLDEALGDKSSRKSATGRDGVQTGIQQRHPSR